MPETVAARITDLLRGHTGPAEEAAVLAELASVPAGGLDAVLADLDLGDLVGSLDDRRWGPDHRSALLDLLCRQRRPELGTERLAELVRALHRGRTPQTHEEAIRDILLAQRGPDLLALKYRINDSGDYHDLEHLVFEDLSDDSLRREVLDHIATESAGLTSPDLRILCDIDDTVICALHDDRYPRGTVYPGVVALLHELDRGAAEDPGRAGDLTFVTARPGGPRGLVESYTRNGLAELGLPPHAVLGGSLLNLHTKAAIAERKIQNFERDRLLFPESRTLFIGDSGQADAQVGVEMLRLDPEHVEGVFIHNVTDLDTPAREEWARRGVVVFDRYDELAAEMHRRGLISGEGLERVAAAVAHADVAAGHHPT